MCLDSLEGAIEQFFKKFLSQIRGLLSSPSIHVHHLVKKYANSEQKAQTSEAQRHVLVTVTVYDLLPKDSNQKKGQIFSASLWPLLLDTHPDTKCIRNCKLMQTTMQSPNEFPPHSKEYAYGLGGNIPSFIVTSF